MAGLASPLTTAEEQRLIQRVLLASDERAFGDLTHPYLPRLRGYLRGLSGSDSDADDLMQTTLIKCWQQLTSFDHKGRFVAWLFKVAHNEFLQWLRARKRYVGALDKMATEVGQSVQSGDAAAAALDVAGILSTLPEDARAALVLSRGVGLSHAEIALAMDKPLGTVKSLVNRATQEVVNRYG
ncbi:MAG: RNA polymerase sigma factor [Pseudomonadota bacterium]